METKHHTPSTESVSARPTVRPAVDIYENKDELLLVIDLPGVSRDQVFIDLDKDTLSIVGKRPAEPPEGSRVLAGQGFGWDFKRQFSVSQDIDMNGIKANLENGVLEVHLPRHERTKPRRIAIGS
jgi:HSP20 family molecular chaperone IbpA